MRKAINDLLTVEQVAELRGCSDSLVRRHARFGSLPALRMAGVWVIRRADAMAFTPRKKSGRPKKFPDNSLA